MRSTVLVTALLLLVGPQTFVPPEVDLTPVKWTCTVFKGCLATCNRRKGRHAPCSTLCRRCHY